jgi:hypothetical protein
MVGLAILVFFSESIEETIFAEKNDRLFLFYLIVLLIATILLRNKFGDKISAHSIIGKCYHCKNNSLWYYDVWILKCLNCNNVNRTNHLLTGGNFVLGYLSIGLWRDKIFPLMSIFDSEISLWIIPWAFVFSFLNSRIIHLKPK